MSWSCVHVHARVPLLVSVVVVCTCNWLSMYFFFYVVDLMNLPHLHSLVSSSIYAWSLSVWCAKQQKIECESFAEWHKRSGLMINDNVTAVTQNLNRIKIIYARTVHRILRSNYLPINSYAQQCNSSSLLKEP